MVKNLLLLGQHSAQPHLALLSLDLAPKILKILLMALKSCLLMEVMKKEKNTFIESFSQNWLPRNVIVSYNKTKGFSASKCNVGKWIFSKLGTCWEIVWKDFGFFWGIFWIFLGGIFFEEFFGCFFFARNFFGRNSLFALLKSGNLSKFESDWCFCQDFVSMKKEEEFRSLEVRRKLIALWN